MIRTLFRIFIGMKLRLLADRLERMPFVKVVVPFAAGIALADCCTLPLWFAAGAFVLAGALALLLRSSAALVAMLAAAGIGAAEVRRTETALPCGVATLFEIEVDGLPADRGRYAGGEGVVTAWRDPVSGGWHAVRERVVLHADSAAGLSAGERMLCRCAVRPLRGAEGYRRQMMRRGVAGRVWISHAEILERGPSGRGDLHREAVRRLDAWGLSGDAGAVVRAMTAGDRRGIGPGLRALYARSGLAHLLALSGLHAGLVFLLVNAALWWLPLLRRGHLIRCGAVVAAVWSFVAAAGWPPSAVRAAVMCTALQLARASSSEYTALNALAASGLGMLLWRPEWLFDVGFRLSFVAVAAILAWGVPLCRRWRTGRRWLDVPRDAVVVGLAASLATAPLVSHHFGVVPLLGALVTPLALLPAAAVVLCGVVWLLLPAEVWAVPLREAAQGAAGAIDALARAVAAVPGGAVGYSLTAGETAAVYLLFAAGTLAAWCAESKKNVLLPS